MTGPGDGPPDARAPQGFENNPSLWESIVLTRFSGATTEERDALAQATYTGFIDRNVDRDTRAAARDDAEQGFRFFGVPFDWAQWRREMGY